MRDPTDDFERRLSEMLRRYMAEGVPAIDTHAAAGRVLERTRSRVSGFWAFAGAIVTVGGAALVVVALAIRPAIQGLAPTHPVTSPYGTAVGSAAAPTSSSCGSVAFQSPNSAPPTSLAPPSQRELSDRFWGYVTRFVPGGYGYETIRQITEGSHLVVVGRVVGRSSGDSTSNDCRQWAGYAPYGVVAISEVLKGEPHSMPPGTILVAGLASDSIDDGNLPTGQVVLFLKNYAQMRVDEGVPPVDDPDDAFHYFLPNRYQTILRELDGVIDIIDAPAGWWKQYGPFPSDVEHQPFDVVVERIRRIAED